MQPDAWNSHQGKSFGFNRKGDWHALYNCFIYDSFFLWTQNKCDSVLVKENFKQHLIVFSNIESCGVWSSFVLWWEEEREVEVNAKPENGGGRLLSDQIVGHQRNAPDWGDVKTTWFSPLVLTSRIVGTDWKSWKSEPIPRLADSTTVKMAQAQNDVNWRRSSLLQFNCCII